MEQLDPTQSYADDVAAPASPKANGVSVIAQARTNLPPPAQYIRTKGTGSNLSVAAARAVSKIFKDPLLRGRKATSILQTQITLSFGGYEYVEENDDE